MVRSRWSLNFVKKLTIFEVSRTEMAFADSIAMNVIRLFGHLLLWCGFLAGAFVAVQNAEKVGDAWNTIRWPLYLLALAIGVTGVVFLRMTQKQAATHADKLDADIQVLEISIQNLLTRLTELIESRQHIDVYAVHGMIDSRLMESISSFVDARKSLIHTYGLRQYAELMTDFSIAERNVNRAWSASADGYIDEVWLSLERAERRLQTVGQHLNEYKEAALLA